jgi:hypothetical protein
VNSVSLSHSSRSLPLNDPMKAFWVGLPGDVMPFNHSLLRPAQDAHPSELGSIVGYTSLAEARAVLSAWKHDYNPASQHPSVYVIEEKRFLLIGM